VAGFGWPPACRKLEFEWWPVCLYREEAVPGTWVRSLLWGGICGRPEAGTKPRGALEQCQDPSSKAIPGFVNVAADRSGPSPGKIAVAIRATLRCGMSSIHATFFAWRGTQRLQVLSGRDGSRVEPPEAHWHMGCRIPGQAGIQRSRPTQPSLPSPTRLRPRLSPWTAPRFSRTGASLFGAGPRFLAVGGGTAKRRRRVRVVRFRSIAARTGS
jgi:hypothetical protein